MPYAWTDPASDDAPEWRLRLWPHRSLTPGGFVTFIAITSAMFLLPLSAVLGTALLWGLLPFMMGTLALAWAMIRRNSAEAALTEDLSLSPTRIQLTRHDPRGPDRSWSANPYWVRVALDAHGGPVENYLTLTGAGREVELGAFLSPGERKTLFEDLNARLSVASRTPPLPSDDTL